MSMKIYLETYLTNPSSCRIRIHKPVSNGGSMKARSVLVAGGVTALVAAVTVGVTATSQAAVVTPNAVSMAAAPYLFPAAGGNVNPTAVMAQTNVKAFTLAF